MNDTMQQVLKTQSINVPNKKKSEKNTIKNQQFDLALLIRTKAVILFKPISEVTADYTKHLYDCGIDWSYEDYNLQGVFLWPLKVVGCVEINIKMCYEIVVIFRKNKKVKISKKGILCIFQRRNLSRHWSQILLNKIFASSWVFYLVLELRRNYSIVVIILIKFKKLPYKCSFMAY